MFQINDYLIYGTTDVCQMVGMRTEKLTGGIEREYYILKPVYDCNSTIFSPVDNGKTQMRRILTVEEVYGLFRVVPDADDDWIDNDRMRMEKFSEILKSGDRRDLVKLIKALLSKRKEQIENGKNFRSTDEGVMKAAEKLLYNEFALILDIRPGDVAGFIIEQIENNA